jgi:hypothetical protein
VARTSRTQLAYGAVLLLVPFLTAVFFASRTTFDEQIKQLEEQSRVIAVSVTSTAEAGRLERDAIARAITSIPVPDDGVVAVLDVKTGTVAAARGPAAVLAALDAGQLPDLTLREDVDGFGAGDDDCRHFRRAAGAHDGARGTMIAAAPIDHVRLDIGSRRQQIRLADRAGQSRQQGCAWVRHGAGY